MKRESKKYLYYALLTAFLSIVAGIFFHLNTATTNAGTAYKELFQGESSITKSGKYYLEYDTENYTVYISTNKTNGYKKTPIAVNSSYANGKGAYYTRDNALYYYVFSSQKEKRVKKFPVAEDGYHISTVYGGRLFITRGSFDNWKYWTYSYNIRSKQYKLVKSDCTISARKGKYVIGTTEYRTDVSPSTLILYKITPSGLSKIKTLSAKALSGKIVGKKIYYFSYASKTSMQKGTLYCCKIDGSGRKKLGTFSSTQEYGGVYCSDIDSKKCTIMIDEQRYEYTYATKKLKKLKESY